MYSKDDASAHKRVMAWLLTASDVEVENRYQQSNRGLIHYLNLVDGTDCACLDCLSKEKGQ